MKLYKSISVSVDPGEEKVEEIIRSTAAEPIRAISFNFEKGADIDFILRIGRYTHIDIPTLSLEDSGFSWLLFEHDLPVGQAIRVGFRNGTAAAITYWITLQYEIIV